MVTLSKAFAARVWNLQVARRHGSSGGRGQELPREMRMGGGAKDANLVGADGGNLVDGGGRGSSTPVNYESTK